LVKKYEIEIVKKEYELTFDDGRKLKIDSFSKFSLESGYDYSGIMKCKNKKQKTTNGNLGLIVSIDIYTGEN
jgi:hypothetical protein